MIWAVLLLALGAFYYFYEVAGEKKRQEATKQRELLLHFAADAVTGFVIQRDQDTIRATKRDGRWLITEPLTTPGDEQKYRELVRQVAELRYTRIVEEQPQKLEPFGLTPPQLDIHVTVQDQTPLRLRIGGANPTGSGYYAQVEGRTTVYLINAAAKDVLNASLYDVRDKIVLSFVPAEVQEVQVVHGNDPPVVLQRQDADQWNMTAPVNAKADTQQVRAVLQRLQDAKVQTFVVEETSDLQAYGLQDPTLRVTLAVGADRVQHTLVVGQESPDHKGVYARRGTTSQVVLLPKDFWKGLPTAINGWRDKTLLQYDREHITRLELTAPQSTIHITRSGVRQYTLEQPLRTQGDSDTIFSLLGDLKELKAKDIVADAPQALSPYGLDEPRLRITVQEEQPNQAATQHTILFGAQADAGVYVMLPDRPTVYVVDMQAAKRFLETTVLALQDKKILAFTPESIHKIQVQYADSQLVLERHSQDWRLLEPQKQAIAQRWKVDNLLQDLSTLNYAKMVTETLTDKTAYGLDTPQVRLHLWQQDGSLVGPLVLGKTTDSEVAETTTVYAQVGSASPLYALSAEVLKDIPRTAADLTSP